MRWAEIRFPIYVSGKPQEVLVTVTVADNATDFQVAEEFSRRLQEHLKLVDLGDEE